MPRYKVDQALQHDLDKLFAWFWVLSIVYMVIYACKHLIFALICPKYDPIVLIKCAQHCQLRTNNILPGVIVLTICAINYLYGSCATTTLYNWLRSHGASFTMLLLFLPFSCLCMVYSSLYYTISQFLKSCLVSISDWCHVHCYYHSSLCSSH